MLILLPRKIKYHEVCYKAFTRRTSTLCSSISSPDSSAKEQSYSRGDFDAVKKHQKKSNQRERICFSYETS